MIYNIYACGIFCAHKPVLLYITRAHEFGILLGFNILNIFFGFQMNIPFTRTSGKMAVLSE